MELNNNIVWKVQQEPRSDIQLSFIVSTNCRAYTFLGCMEVGVRVYGVGVRVYGVGVRVYGGRS